MAISICPDENSVRETVILDFHPPRIQQAKAQLAKDEAAGQSNFRMWVQDEATAIDSADLTNQVVSRLPFVARFTNLKASETYFDLMLNGQFLVEVLYKGVRTGVCDFLNY